MKDRATEIREAMAAADDTLMHLARAKDCLSSANGWGWVDMLGGGMLSTFMKRSKMGGAKEAIEDAKDAMRRFAREMRDVNELLSVDIELDDFLGFADFFFDGVIADWMMQSRIGKAREQTDEAIRQVRMIRARLDALL